MLFRSNQGAWYQIRHQLDRPLAGRELLYAGRAPAAAPATGIAKVHDAEQAALVSAALNSSSKEESARETRRLAADVAKSADDTRSVASGRRKR